MGPPPWRLARCYIVSMVAKMRQMDRDLHVEDIWVNESVNVSERAVDLSRGTT